MLQYMLDTDTASYIINNRYPNVSRKFVLNFDQVCISCTTEAELRYGALRRKNQRLIEKVDNFCQAIPCLAWNCDVAHKYAELRTYLEEQGKLIGAMDMLIAAAALAENLTLVTNNITHFSRVPKLKLDNWLE